MQLVGQLGQTDESAVGGERGEGEIERGVVAAEGDRHRDLVGRQHSAGSLRVLNPRESSAPIPEAIGEALRARGVLLQRQTRWVRRIELCEHAKIGQRLAGAGVEVTLDGS